MRVRFPLRAPKYEKKLFVACFLFLVRVGKYFPLRVLSVMSLSGLFYVIIIDYYKTIFLKVIML